MASNQKESDTWRHLFLRVRLPFATAGLILIGGLLAPSSVGFPLTLVLASWWAGPAIIYLMTIRKRVLSWTLGAGLIALTAILLAPEVQSLRYWDEEVRAEMGFFQFPGLAILKPLIEYFLVVTILPLEVTVIAIRRRRRASQGTL